MNKLISLMIILLVTHKTNATSIVVCKYKNAIYVATDSYSEVMSRDPKNRVIYHRSICKIHKFGDYYVVLAGHDTDALLLAAVETFKPYNSKDKIISDFVDSMRSYYLIM